MKRYLFLISIVISFAIKAQTPQILWFYDVNDESAGQTSMGDINNDGYVDFVFGCYRNDSMVYALSGLDGSLLWKYNTTGFQEGCNDAAPLIYDVDNDSVYDVFIASSCNPQAYLFHGPSGAIKWQTNTAGRGSDSPPVIGDLDGDGALEIVFGQMGGWVMCLNAINGTVKWNFPVDINSWIQTAPTLVDLTGNGMLDFVVATWHFNNDSNRIYAYRGDNQNMLWSLPINKNVYHGTAVADLNRNGKPDLVLGDYSGTLYAVEGETGTLLWTYNAGMYIGSPAVIADLNNDGYCEIVFCAGYKIITLKHDGTLLWDYIIPGYEQSFRGAALSDVDNDSLPDVIFGTSGGELMGLKGLNGQQIFSINLEQHYGDTFAITTAPVIGDFNKDGKLDAFVVGGKSSYPNFQNNYGRAYAVEIGNGTGPDWPMFQYDCFRRGSLCEAHNTGIKTPISSLKVLEVFPNPLQKGNSLQLVFNESDANKMVEILDITGHVLYQRETKERILKIMFEAPQGLYFVKVYYADYVINKKIVVL